MDPSGGMGTIANSFFPHLFLLFIIQWPLQLKMAESKVLLDDEAVSAGEKLQHQLWDKMEKVTPDGWCTDLEQALDGKWSVIYNEDSSIVAMKEALALLRSRSSGKSPSAFFKHCSIAPFFLSDEQFITNLRLNIGQSAIRNPVLLELHTLDLRKP